MFANRLFVLIAALVLLTVAAIGIESGIAPATSVSAYVSHSDYVRDPSGYPAPYVSHSEMLREQAINAAPYVSRSDTLRTNANIAPIDDSRSDAIRSIGQ